MITKLLEDFKQFALRGNMIDLAIGVILGSRFSSLVQSLVDNIIMPPISILLGRTNFSELEFQIGTAPKLDESGVPVIENGEQVMAPAMLEVGDFLQVCLNFTIIAFCVFLIVRLVNKAQTALMDDDDREVSPKEKKLPEDIQLLRQIRNELRQLNGENEDGEPITPTSLDEAKRRQQEKQDTHEP